MSSTDTRPSRYLSFRVSSASPCAMERVDDAARLQAVGFIGSRGNVLLRQPHCGGDGRKVVALLIGQVNELRQRERQVRQLLFQRAENFKTVQHLPMYVNSSSLVPAKPLIFAEMLVSISSENRGVALLQKFRRLFDGVFADDSLSNPHQRGFLQLVDPGTDTAELILSQQVVGDKLVNRLHARCTNG